MFVILNLLINPVDCHESLRNTGLTSKSRNDKYGVLFTIHANPKARFAFAVLISAIFATLKSK